jgi:hypothetical protein
MADEKLLACNFRARSSTWYHPWPQRGLASDVIRCTTAFAIQDAEQIKKEKKRGLSKENHPRPRIAICSAH